MTTGLRAAPDAEAASAVSGKPASFTAPQWAAPAFVATLTFLAFAASLRFDFVYDDRVQILANPWLDSWRSVPRFFTESFAAFTGNTGSAFWRPLFLLWLLLNRSLFGLAPWGWHLAAIVLHCTAAVLAYFLARRLLKDGFLAAVAALLFALWPSTVETAAWVSGATDSLLAVLLLAALLAFLRAQQRRSRTWLVFSLGLYSLALLSKETAVVLPALIAAYAWLCDPQAEGNGCRGRLRRLAAVLAPFLVLTAIYFGLRARVFAGASQAPLLTGWREMVMTWPAAICFYLRLLVFPYPVSPHYNLKVIGEFKPAPVLLPALALIVLAIVLCLVWRRNSHQSRRAVATSLVWILAPLAPVLYLRPLAPDDFAHIRYLYLPTIGLALLLAFLLGKFSLGGLRVFGRPALPLAIALVLLAAAGLATARAEMHWATNYTLFAHAAEVAPHNPRALTNFAIELGERRRYGEAVDLFQHALALNPRLWYAAMDLGYTFFRMGQYESAEGWISRAIEISPRDPEQYTYLAAVEIKLGRLDKAEEALRAAIKRAPSRPGYQYGLGLVLEREGKRDQAIQAYRRELANDPGHERARARLQELGASP